ncbi:hypothetical protein [Methylobacillus sp.]|uniref:hypothetical protein n=1 Tax=Methylobacillus sp. TaxID=56818 RepID=UPI0012CC5A15|nr:hypothetical protein [Methylobacillus sp.]MPS48556.1 hypothetical protein [Methylobacillus sp.]
MSTTYTGGYMPLVKVGDDVASGDLYPSDDKYSAGWSPKFSNWSVTSPPHINVVVPEGSYPNAEGPKQITLYPREYFAGAFGINKTEITFVETHEPWTHDVYDNEANFKAQFAITRASSPFRHFGYRNQSVAEDFGAQIQGVGQTQWETLAGIDAEFGGMYVIPHADRTDIKTVATRMYPRTPASIQSWAPNGAWGSVSIEPNIIFPVAFDTPPLIFITESKDPIALYSINRNAQGKYVSATVIGHYQRVTNEEYMHHTYATAVASHFSYFLVHEDMPEWSLRPTDNVGMQVFNAEEKLLYDSRYQNVKLSWSDWTMRRVPGTIRRFSSSGAQIGGSGNPGSNFTRRVFEANAAVCLNNLGAACGLFNDMVYTYNINNKMYYYSYGMVYGHFLKVEPSLQEKAVTIECQVAGVLAGFSNSGYHIYFRGDGTLSGGPSRTVKVLIASYGNVYQPPITHTLYSKNPTGRSGVIDPRIQKYRSPEIIFSAKTPIAGSVGPLRRRIVRYKNPQAHIVSTGITDTARWQIEGVGIYRWRVGRYVRQLSRVVKLELIDRIIRSTESRGKCVLKRTVNMRMGFFTNRPLIQSLYQPASYPSHLMPVHYMMTFNTGLNMPSITEFNKSIASFPFGSYSENGVFSSMNIDTRAMLRRTQ